MTNGKRKIDMMTNRYTVSKTIKMKLIPIGATMDNFNSNMLLESDTERKENYAKVKLLIDEYHKQYIEENLSKVTFLENLKPYAEEYYGEKDKDKMKELEGKLRKEIVLFLTQSKIFGDMFKKEMITKLLPDFISSEEDLEIVNSFSKFTTYFTNFFQNRKNMYTSEEQSTGIAYRCINDNLPKHLDNIIAYRKAKEKLPQDVLSNLNMDFQGLCGTTIDDVFTVDYFVFVLSQSGIERYNEIIGGYTTVDGKKTKGINEYINLYNQTADKKDRIPNMKPLYKQVLSDRESISFIPTAFENDNELISAVYDLYNTDRPEDDFVSIKTVTSDILDIFENFNQYSLDGIYIQSGAPVTDLSNGMFSSWSYIRDLWNKNYDLTNKPKRIKDIEKYEDKKAKEYKANKCFSLGFFQELIDKEMTSSSICSYYKENVIKLINDINSAYKEAETILENEYDSENNSLKKDEQSVALIKNFLDSIKALEYFIKPLAVDSKEQNVNELFYGKFTPLFDGLRNVDHLYDKVRNYVTQKPYSTEKIKLNFENPQFLGGWDRNKEKDYRSVLLRKDDKYYLGVIDKKNSKIFEDVKTTEDEDCYEKVVYKLLPGPNKMLPKVFFAKSNVEFFAPSEKINTLYKKETFKKGKNFNIDDCHSLIDFYKESLAKHPDWSEYNFEFKDTKDYKDIGEFYKDVKEQGYKISFTKVPTSYIDELVEKGNLYLFQIYNKDFSEHSKGTPNLHTLYFKMLFDERNLKDVVYQLNGGAEMFYRPASIKEKDIVVHKANQPVKNKNPHTDKTHSTFEYDLIKDRRYTKPQFSLHLPITLNFKAKGEVKINDRTRTLLKECDDNYVIGIDRGERHLLYVTVINSKGEIVQQYSLNKIVNEYNGKNHTVDYHELLNRKEEERKKARQNWTTIENIKELKEGYISQVVHKICQLVVKYDAIVVMEDLNSGFKRSRTKVEKQVYQKFEKMLIDKLNYLVDKQLALEEKGGILNAFQLTNEFDSFKKMGLQNGFIFYIPAWLTSKIDPVTGFVDLLKPRYKSVSESKDFISRFDSISYNEEENYFEFDFNYDNFLRGTTSYRKNWTLCTNGERIKTFRNPDKNSEWDSVTVNLTDEFIKLFNDYNIDYHKGNLIDSILSQDKRDFYERFLKLLSLTLQMRNSIINSEVDYLISPVKDKNAKFYDSRNYNDSSPLPANADANGAYNIARKGLWAINQIKEAEDITKVKLSISNKQWLEFAQSGDMRD
ncbi:MAG: type V CRISPR-associated protein Cas12a/Cpf1 [Ruminococcus sp.]|nr:type V CRISPR-associated protein Cas12a/Cpf1 [Ruminococcus sp.]